jgi:hypothetical protein
MKHSKKIITDGRDLFGDVYQQWSKRPINHHKAPLTDWRVALRVELAAKPRIATNSLYECIARLKLYPRGIQSTWILMSKTFNVWPTIVLAVSERITLADRDLSVHFRISAENIIAQTWRIGGERKIGRKIRENGSRFPERYNRLHRATRNVKICHRRKTFLCFIKTLLY